MKEELLVTNIVRFALHDGPGLRTTVFLKGCSLHCPWCANPETIDCCSQYWFRESVCVGTDKACCISQTCSREYAKSLAGKPAGGPGLCPISAIETIGTDFSIAELEAAILKDKPFWGDNGGVTFSGGEPLLQIERMEPLLVSLTGKKVNVAFETAGGVSEAMFSKMLQYADFVYLDIKILTASAQKLIGLNEMQYLNNLQKLSESGVPYTLRFPLIRPFTCNDENIDKIASVIGHLSSPKVELFACHNFGDEKARRMGIDRQTVSHVTADDLRLCQEKLERAGAAVSILHY